MRRCRPRIENAPIENAPGLSPLVPLAGRGGWGRGEPPTSGDPRWDRGVHGVGGHPHPDPSPYKQGEGRSCRPITRTTASPRTAPSDGREYPLAMPVLVEIIGSTVDDCLAIEAAGAHRVELCAALPMGGLTPSLGTVIEAKRRCRLPLMVMLRPREAGMAYSEGEWATMLADLPRLLDAGADGIVTGVSLPGGALDLARLEILARMVRGVGRPVELVCHRAFDLTPDPCAALEGLVALGYDRILTSGQKPTAAEGAGLIAGLVRAAAGRIEILPACGIDASNAAALVARTGVAQVHLAAYGPVRDTSTRAGAVAFGAAPPEADDHAFARADVDQIAAVVAAVG